MPIRVEVFPMEPYRWIAEIDAPKGGFSTETPVASDISAEVRASIQAVLGVADPDFELIDDLGEPWTPARGPEQMQRLDIDFDKDSWIPNRLPWWRRLVGQRQDWFGDCPACGHDWREHVPADGVCGECRYEIEHEEPEAPTVACRVMPSVEVRLATSPEGRPLSAGPTGWWGWIQEDDDPDTTPGGRERDRLAGLAFNYREVGASAGELPPGYRHITVVRRLGAGRACFQSAVERLMTWDMHRRAGLLVDSAQPAVVTGQVAVVSILLGQLPIGVPVRVVEVVDGPSVQGFAYGTLRGHLEAGEERFLIHHDADDSVRATIRAFSRPARWYVKLGAPLARRIQDRTTNRYLDALAAPP